MSKNMHTICIEFILNTYISVANKRRETCKFISNNDKKLMWQTISDKVEKCGNETSVPGVMAQMLRALPVLEDPVWFPALKRSSSQSFVTVAPGDLSSYSGLWEPAHTWHSYTHLHTHSTSIKKVNLKIKLINVCKACFETFI